METDTKSDKIPVRFVEIDESHAGQRLDNFLIFMLKGVPKSRIYRILRKGEVRINRGRAKPDYRLELGDVVRIPPVRTAPAPERPDLGDRFAWLADRVLYEDDQVLVLDKPTGLAVHGGSGVSVGLIEALRQLHPEAPMLELAHRLDRETSGCLLVAKTRPALMSLHQQLREGGMEKRYLALVMGGWRGGARHISAALERGEPGRGKRKVEVSEEGKEAESIFTPKGRYGTATLMEIKLLTGRTHQARVHAAHVNHPIAGDDKYGSWEFNRELRPLGLKRLFLHARQLSFTHPTRGSKMTVEAPIPSELTAVLERLRDATPA